MTISVETHITVNQYRPLQSTERLAVTLTYLAAGKTPCAQVDNCERIIQFFFLRSYELPVSVI